MPKERGIYHLNPAVQATTDISVHLDQLIPGLTLPNQELVRNYAEGLMTTIQIYQAEQNVWVQRMGGKSYSEIAAISQFMFLTFVDARSKDEITRFARSPFAHISHLVWRIIAGIDDAVDTPGIGPLDISQITDTDGVPVARMMRELMRIPKSSQISDFLAGKIFHHTQKKEATKEIGFEEAFRSKEATTGRLTSIGSFGAYLQLTYLFPIKTFRISPITFIENSVAGSLIAQLVDDIVDLPSDLNVSRASSLVLAAARDSKDLLILEAMIKQKVPVNIATLLAMRLNTGTVLSQKYQELRLKMGKAPADLCAYSDNQFYFVT